jgi:hypothetical protein
MFANIYLSCNPFSKANVLSIFKLIMDGYLPIAYPEMHRSPPINLQNGKIKVKKFLE